MTPLAQAIENNLLIIQEPSQRIGNSTGPMVISTETLNRGDFIPLIMGCKQPVLFTPHALMSILKQEMIQINHPDGETQKALDRLYKKLIEDGGQP